MVTHSQTETFNLINFISIVKMMIQSWSITELLQNQVFFQQMTSVSLKIRSRSPIFILDISLHELHQHSKYDHSNSGFPHCLSHENQYLFPTFSRPKRNFFKTHTYLASSSSLIPAITGSLKFAKYIRSWCKLFIFQTWKSNSLPFQALKPLFLYSLPIPDFQTTWEPC